MTAGQIVFAQVRRLRWRQRILALAFGSGASLVLMHAVVAGPREVTPEQNDSIAITQYSLAGLNTVAVATGLAPGPFGTPAEIAAFGLDIGLKNTPATLRIPGDLETNPNWSPEGSMPGLFCHWRLANVIPEGARGNGSINTTFGGLFFIAYDPLDDVWSSLGTGGSSGNPDLPAVYHPHADVEVRVSNPWLTGDQPAFPEGDHALEWTAGTNLNYVLDIALPGALIPLFAYGEAKLANKYMAKNISRSVAQSQAEMVYRRIGAVAELIQIGEEISDPFDAMEWYQRTSTITVVNRATQVLRVWDTHIPEIRNLTNSRIEVQDITLEATDFGGVRFGRARNDLLSSFEPFDYCGKQFEVSTETLDSELLAIADTPTEIVWTAREIDGGPYGSDTSLFPNQTRGADRNITTTLTQRILVRDTQAPILVPPPGFSRYSATPVPVSNLSLGLARVVDLADPLPVVENDAPAELAVDTRYTINWSSSDSSGNSTEAGADAYRQVVTIKSPGSNTPPSAESDSGSTLTSTPVEFTLRGSDPDIIDGVADPLEFVIDDYPENGQFEAPLFPFFIEDFRLSPVGDVEEDNALRRTSPLQHLADEFRLLNPEDRGQFLEDEICSAPAGSQNETVFGNVIPVDFVLDPTYVHVDDDNIYYIRDEYYACGETDYPRAFPGALPALPRLSKWTEGGELVEMVSLYPQGTYPDLGPGVDWIAGEDFSTDQTGAIWLDFDYVGPTFFARITSIWSYSSGFESASERGQVSYDEQETIAGYRLGGIAGDEATDLLYVVSRDPGLSCINCQSDDIPPIVIRSFSDVDVFGSEPIGEIDVSAIDQFRPGDIELDSEGNVYILDGGFNRIHKFSPTHQDESGEWVLSEYIGWLGRCSANLLNEFGVPYNGCDEEREVSRGYACTDATCARAVTSGDAPGQFYAPGSIEMSPRDVLYVADTFNSRVQRFGPDGTFAGQAVSTGSGINQGEEPGFILGNMGQPSQISVNSSSFYVMEPDPVNGDNFVHVFKTLPFYDVTDSTAKVSYVSEFDFQGVDSFSFITDDGIDESVPATVNVTVTRAFRPPDRLQSACYADATLVDQVPCSLDEDTELVIRVTARDLDGFVSTGGLDTLDFEIVEEPANGELTLLSTTDNAAVYRYTPDANFNGDDEFTFTASDGFDTSDEDRTVLLTVVPVPDPVAIELPDSVLAGRGFRQVITGTFDDVDNDEASDPTLTFVVFGDGAVAGTPNWSGSGRFDSNGREIDPQTDLGIANGVLITSHIYSSTGSLTYQAVMTNEEGSLAESIGTTTVDVIEATGVGADMTLPEDAVDPDTAFPVQIAVTNHLPVGWAGLVAGNVSVSITAPAGLGLTPIDGRCTPGAPIVCELGDLTQGESTTLALNGVVALADARVNGDYMLDIELFDDGPTYRAMNRTIDVISVSDQDDDGVIDVDDAFPSDPRYTLDTDGDGLADSWEEAYGYDPLVADNTSADEDSDGFSLADEFANDSFPRLAEFEGIQTGSQLELVGSSVDNRFGQAIAGGDLDGDGFADTVIGALLQDGPGAAFISYGSPSGANPSLSRIDPPAGVTEFGRAVAVGDFDGNGYPDLAIGAANAVTLHFNNGQILETPDLVLDGAAGRNFGLQLVAGDLDGDAIDDLVVLDNGAAALGSAHLYLSTRGGIAASALEVTSASVDLGDSAAIGDIDGDELGDLMVGSAFTGDGYVVGLLGADNDWATTVAPLISFQLQGAAGSTRFAYSIASGHDIGGDGIDDLVVGAYSGIGAVSVYDSASSYFSVASPGDVSAVAPSQVLAGGAAGDQLGVRVALSQLDTDGLADLVAGANRVGADAGEVRVYRGSAAGFIPSAEISTGATDYDMLGYFVAVPGDIDGDGFNDVAGGAPNPLAAGNPAPDGGYVENYYHAFLAIDPDEDLDFDGVRFAADNCPDIANTDQTDLDGDGIGNVCDSDADGDGFLNVDDNCPLINSLDQTNSDSDADGDICDNDDDNDDVLDADDPWPTDGRYTADSDGDGMPNEYELLFGLNPNDASDATTDLDSDGRNNLNEFLAETDIGADDVAPLVTAPADVLVNSKGVFTPVSLGTASAVDALDGAVTVAPDDPGPFAPGSNVVTWRASDAAGNAATDTQQVNVIPRVSFSGTSQPAAEGVTVILSARLNGSPVASPVTVPYTLGGSAENGVDYTVSGGAMSAGGGGVIGIDSFDTGILEFDIAADALVEGEETIVVTMGTPSNAVVGDNTVHTIRILEGNVAPIVSIAVEQETVLRSTVFADAGEVTMTVSTIDPNPGDSHTIDWSATDGLLLPNEGYGATSFTFDPTGLAAGLYAVRVTVTDSGSPVESTSVTRLIRVAPSRPLFVAGVDSDGDGTDDIDEGGQDANANGVDDAFEPSSLSNVLVATAPGRAALQVREGLRLVLGGAAFASGNDAIVTMAEVSAYGDAGIPGQMAADSGFDYPVGIFDFEISGLGFAGESTPVVIPLTAAIPADASYRKYVSSLGWSEFVSDGANGIASAPGVMGACPAPGSSDYQAGLNVGDYCVELTLEDGGPNDADGVANRVIRDPGGVAVVHALPDVQVSRLTSPNQTVGAAAQDVVLLRFALDASTAGATLNSITLDASGSGNDATAIDAVRLWLDANDNGTVDAGDTELGSGSYSGNNGQLVLMLDSPLALADGSTEFLVTYDF